MIAPDWDDERRKATAYFRLNQRGCRVCGGDGAVCPICFRHARCGPDLGCQECAPYRRRNYHPLLHKPTKPRGGTRGS